MATGKTNTIISNGNPKFTTCKLGINFVKSALFLVPVVRDKSVAYQVVSQQGTYENVQYGGIVYAGYDYSDLALMTDGIQKDSYVIPDTTATLKEIELDLGYTPSPGEEIRFNIMLSYG